jgi:hypothetical protein
MTLINTKGMAFFGPGSEWFWAALQFTALTITFIAIYRQLRTARSSHAVEQVAEYTRQLDHERMIRHQLAILMAARDKVEVPSGSAITIGNYFEGLGSLGRSGYLDVTLLWRVFGLVTLRWWAVLETFVQRQRIEHGDSVYEDFEWLVRALAKMDRRAGRTLSIDATYVATWSAGAIEGLQDNLRLDQSLRTVSFASPDALDTVQSLSATPPTPTAPAEMTKDEQEHQSD